MSEFQDIQNLIRLKRHEQPSPEFVEQFVKSFQQRQRSEMLNQSARGLLWERVTTYFDGLLAPKWGWAAATAAVLVGTFSVLQSSAPQSSGLARNGSEAGRMAPISEEEVRQYLDVKQNLLSGHYRGGFGDERETQTADTLPRTHGTVVPVGFRADIQQ